MNVNFHLYVYFSLINNNWSYFTPSMIKSSWKQLPIVGTNKYTWKYFNARGESVDRFTTNEKGTSLFLSGPYQGQFMSGLWTDSSTSKTYYFINGKRATGWQKINDRWRYFSPFMIKNGWKNLKVVGTD